MLVDKGRIRMNIDPIRWRSELMAIGLREHPGSGDIGIQAAALPDFHGDPADRLIVATAMQERATLATADKAILGWKGPLQRTHATRWTPALQTIDPIQTSPHGNSALGSADFHERVGTVENGRRLSPTPMDPYSYTTRFTAAWRNCSFADRSSVRASKVFLHFMPHDYTV